MIPSKTEVTLENIFVLVHTTRPRNLMKIMHEVQNERIAFDFDPEIAVVVRCPESACQLPKT